MRSARTRSPPSAGSATAHPPAASRLARPPPRPETNHRRARPHQATGHHRLTGAPKRSPATSPSSTARLPPPPACASTSRPLPTLRCAYHDQRHPRPTPHPTSTPLTSANTPPRHSPAGVRSPFPQVNPRSVSRPPTAAETQSSPKNQEQAGHRPRPGPAPVGTLRTPDRPAGHCLQLNARPAPNDTTLLFS